MNHECPRCFKLWNDGGIINEYILFLFRRNPEYVYMQDKKTLRHLCGNCW